MMSNNAHLCIDVFDIECHGLDTFQVAPALKMLQTNIRTHDRIMTMTGTSEQPAGAAGVLSGDDA